MWINNNGLFCRADAIPVAANDMGLRYGLSLFETMRWTGSGLPLLEGHLARLKAGLKVLEAPFPLFLTADFLHTEIKNLVKRNGIIGAARVRLQVTPVLPFPEAGTFSGIHYRIECCPCEGLKINDLGLKIGFSEKGFQTIPAPFCAFKTGNYAPYALAAMEAKRRDLDDILMLNQWGRIGESSTANVFWVQHDRLFTPPLSEGIVAGVGRSHLLEVLSQNGFMVEEQSLPKEHLKQISALFLTNAFRGLRWVGSCENLVFEKGPAEVLFKKAFSVLA